MGWNIINNQIIYTHNGKDIVVSAEDLYLLNSNRLPERHYLTGVNSPGEELNVRFSRFSATISIHVKFEAEVSAISVEILAQKGQHKVKIKYLDGNLPDSVVIDSIWYNLISSAENASNALKEAGIFSEGKISLVEYAALRKGILKNSDVSMIDDADTYVSSHSLGAVAMRSPVGLKAKLYSYQLNGFNWMRFIANEKCGCILGDEMGLGKTLQVIALLNDRKQDGHGPSLVIAPVSLLENWKREFEKFAAGLKVKIHHGYDRTGFYTELLNYDVTIISYNTAVSDLSLLKMIKWDVLALDEAQNIKNPYAQRSKSVKKVPHSVAIAITGTPFENHLTDIWSIMDFLLPNYLGDIDRFQMEFPDDLEGAKKIEPLVTPFMLRRLVKDVAQDLPAKVNIPQILSMSDLEAVEYEQIRHDIIEKYKGQQASLPMLQKLRMYCTHPFILDNKSDADPVMVSTKYAHLCELLSEIIRSKEKAILFTSYNGMFDILGNDIPRRFSIPAFSINGTTPISDRQKIIDEFSSVIGAALLVLNPRAAGTGLNITAATRVIHYNLEWNPALEDQASARSYRRGQDKTVFIYRLYYKDTVEEIINDRIEGKRSMSGVAVQGVDGGRKNTEDIMQALMMAPGGY